MKISELFVKQGSVEIEGTIKEIDEPRTFNKYGKDLKVANAILEDDSGAIKLTLWNDDIEKVKQGDKIRITNGFVNEFQGEKQLTSGKFGKIEKLGSGKSISKTEEMDSEMSIEEEKISGEEDILGADEDY